MIKFTPWDRFYAKKDDKVIQDFLEGVGKTAHQIFVAGMRGGHSGRRYGSHTASSPGEYPANETGALEASSGYDVSANQVEIGTNTSYANFLRNGTRKMARRKMSDSALQEAMSRNSGKMERWVRFGK